MTAGPSAATAVSMIRSLGFTHVLSIPDSESRLLHAAVGDDPDLDLIVPCREGESVAIAAGLWVGGAKPLLIVQNTGLMEAGDALRGCGIGPKIPLRMLIGWRGFTGVEAGKLPIDSAYPYTEPLLQAWNVPYEILDGADGLDAIERMDATAARTHLPAAVLVARRFAP